jgi:hypothetical protein
MEESAMPLEGRKYLEELVGAIICIPDAFRIRLEDGKYIFGVISKDQKFSDYYAVSAIYDTIVDLDKKIKYSFSQALTSDLPETLDGDSPFSELAEKEFEAMHHIENMVYRVSILWDLLAQLCNVKYHTGLETDKIYYNRYFTRFSSGEDKIEIAKEIKEYLDEKDDTTADINQWTGNHAFLTDYRNKMTHRVTPSITSISSLGFSLRPPAMYLLHRVTEDYYKVSYFLCQLINDFLEQYKDWAPFLNSGLDGDSGE